MYVFEVYGSELERKVLRLSCCLFFFWFAVRKGKFEEEE